MQIDFQKDENTGEHTAILTAENLKDIETLRDGELCQNLILDHLEINGVGGEVQEFKRITVKKFTFRVEEKANPKAKNEPISKLESKKAVKVKKTRVKKEPKIKIPKEKKKAVLEKEHVDKELIPTASKSWRARVFETASSIENDIPLDSPLLTKATFTYVTTIQLKNAKIGSFFNVLKTSRDGGQIYNKNRIYRLKGLSEVENFFEAEELFTNNGVIKLDGETTIRLLQPVGKR